MQAAENYVGTCHAYAAAVWREQWVPPQSDYESETVPMVRRTTRAPSPPLLNDDADDTDDSFAEMEERYPTPADDMDDDW